MPVGNMRPAASAQRPECRPPVRILSVFPLAGLVTIAVLCAPLCLPTHAVTHEYAIEISSRVPVKYRLDLPVRYPGEVTVEAVWSGPRLIALRLDRPDGNPLRRSGPSPQRLRAEVDAASVNSGSWILTVHSMPTGGMGQGTLTITLPDPPQAAVSSQPVAAESPTAERPWRVARSYPDGFPANGRRLHETIERFRSIVVYETGGSPPDACGWHDELLKYLTEQRDLLLGGRINPPESSQKLLLDVAGAIERVEELRTTQDPVISGPPPEDRELHAAWLRLRRDRLRRLEAELDELLGSVHRGHAPELAKLEWPARLVSCLMACQRHFEERVRVGEHNAINRELARTQWDILLTAGEALRGLSGVNTRIARSTTDEE